MNNLTQEIRVENGFDAYEALGLYGIDAQYEDNTVFVSLDNRLDAIDILCDFNQIPFPEFETEK